MRRSQSIAAGAAALLISWGAPAAAGPPVGEPCAFVELPTVEGGENVLLATDRSGRYQVGVRTHWESPDVIRAHVVLWRDGTPRLGPEADAYGTFAAVSSTGIAVGWAHEGGRRRPVGYAYGQIFALAMPAEAAEAVAVAVNARGDVARDGVVHGSQDSAFVRWDLDAGTATVVDTGGGSIMAVNARGSMVSAGGFGQDGTVFVGGGLVRPFQRDGLWVTPVGLSDTDLVFGRSNRYESPAYLDCR